MIKELNRLIDKRIKSKQKDSNIKKIIKKKEVQIEFIKLEKLSY